MAIIVNGTEIPTDGEIKCGSTSIEKVDVVKDGVTTTVWQKIRICTVTHIEYSYAYDVASGSYYRAREYRHSSCGLGTVFDCNVENGAGGSDILDTYTHTY